MKVVQVRMPDELKQETEDVLHSMGLSLSGAIILFCQQVINQQKIPFTILTPQHDTVLQNDRKEK